MPEPVAPGANLRRLKCGFMYVIPDNQLLLQQLTRIFSRMAIQTQCRCQSLMVCPLQVSFIFKTQNPA